MKNNILKTTRLIDIALINNDSELRVLIDTIGPLEVETRTDHFIALAKSIVGQQLSFKAANTIWNRAIDIYEGELTPERTLEIDLDLLKSAGISSSKAQYLKNLSRAFIDGDIKPDNFMNMGNDEVIEMLTCVKGVGVWTAEMFLIFSLGREDVFSINDVGLQRAIKWLYKLDGKISKDRLHEISSRWAPFRTYASLYLWEAINRNIIAGRIEELKNE